jgi:RNA polymerase sigma-70 factor (ECF subfamily)
MRADDAELIADAKAGDDAAFDALVREHLPALYRFCVRYLGNRDEAEDAVQDALFKAWKAIGRFDDTKPFRPWLFRIARNSATDLMRKRRSHAFSTLDGDDDGSFAETLADPGPLPDELFSRAELGVEVQRALGELSPRERLVVLLRYEDDFSFEEIAEISGMPAGTARSLHHRALKSLRALLSPDA